MENINIYRTLISFLAKLFPWFVFTKFFYKKYKKYETKEFLYIKCNLYNLYKKKYFL